ncbi:hypothetical protein MUY27_03650 [Mucilaginibacter sp. RS28]|uniref:HEAT repeat domain-containing protein n=1 Tax=Mucilaginibacter straminoryzae TaxID=2932774 RepID=A0A9X2BBZ7_9SPHI|nr:hypothetical protein [Mucilaginibacter straminoryzae]MCJ8208788.1 hypothetical protein [Mucilaginibacter straminoryzae]
MSNQLIKAFELIKPENLDETDKAELLRIFEVTESHSIRNKIALILSEVRYQPAIEIFIEKILDPKLYNYNGTLVFALYSLETTAYFLKITEMLYTQGYEARIEAFELFARDTPCIDTLMLDEAKVLLLKQRKKLESINISEKYENSTLHFVDAALKTIAKATPYF